MRKITQIIIHCSATPNDRNATIADIDAGHAARGFKRNAAAIKAFNPHLKSIGYHYVIERDGLVKTGRAIDEVGAHVQGSNSNSIGICLIGLDKFTPSQLIELKALITKIASQLYGKPLKRFDETVATLKWLGISVKGHRDYSPDKNKNGIIERTEWIKNCPNFDVSEWIKNNV